MKLSILIPTFNRADYLSKNLDSLSEIIRKNKFKEEISVLVSNNCSTDNTNEIIRNFSEKNSDISFKYFEHSSNIGLEKNAAFVLSKAESKFVMFLGDDDFLDELYIKKVVDVISKSETVTCILPSIQPINVSGGILKSGRDQGIPSSLSCKGPENAIKNMYRGHQLSGVTFLREGTIEHYYEDCIRNIYLFMFFVGFNCLRGDLYHITDYPVQVTTGDNVVKDWSYSLDGLFGERFANTKSLFLKDAKNRYLAEISMLAFYKWQCAMAYKIGGSFRLYSFKLALLFGVNISTKFRLYLFKLYLKEIYKKFIS